MKTSIFWVVFWVILGALNVYGVHLKWGAEWGSLCMLFAAGAIAGLHFYKAAVEVAAR